VKDKYIITCERRYYRDYTLGTVKDEAGNTIGTTLEDPYRGQGVKLECVTCIGEGDHIIIMSYSSRFKREMLQIYNQADLSCLYHFEYKDLNGTRRRTTARWTGIRVHNGKTVEHTHGCPLWRGDLELIENFYKQLIEEGYKQIIWRVIGATP
jgi:hypothetical protein